MRLLQSHQRGKFSLTKNYLQNIPCYAILSHTWGKDDEEVSFDDLTNPRNKHKIGYKKLQFCKERAAADGLQYFWVDTCCIDKANYTELAEAIASMFRWYQNATKCYVYLSDVRAVDWESDFRRSRWFTRGWTLQELLAPRSVEFFSQEGQFLGNKSTLEQLIHKVTGIPITALHGQALGDFSIEERLSWAAYRTTTRKEDAAYCLQGICNVFIPLIYGEEDQAWVRLRRAIAEAENPRLAQTPLIAKAVDENDNLIQESLAFPEMQDRRLNVETRHEHTCEWILDLEKYQQWCVLDQGLLWIKGKPGAGKSTVMTFLYDEALKKTVVPVIKLDFFLTARGTELQRTFQGLLRSLLSQLFFQDPATRVQARARYQSKIASFGKARKTWAWQQAELESMLVDNVVALATRQTVTVFVDALDEAGEQSARKMAEYFHRLNDRAVSAQARLKICISCRHYPIVTSRINSLEIVVEDHNTHDIASFVNDRLYLDHVFGDDPLSDWDELKHELSHRAQGVFQWVYLVVPLVQKYIDKGEPLVEVRRKLQHVPPELKHIYNYILQSVIDEDDRPLAFRFFQWICFAGRPLTVTELRYALAINSYSNLNVPVFTEANPDWISTSERMKRRIKALSGGLVEVVPRQLRNEEVAQVGHQSVLDFMLSQGLALLLSLTGDQSLPEHQSIDDLACWSHAKLYWSCLVFHASNDVLAFVADLGRLTRKEIRSPSSFTTRIENLDLGPSFLAYATSHVFEHAKMAKSRRSTNLELEAASLVQLLPSLKRSQHALADHTDIPAIEWGSELLHVACLANMIDMVKYVLTTGGDVNCQDVQYRTPLHVAAQNGYQDIVVCLVAAGANLNAVDQGNYTPLVYATYHSHTTLVKWFLSRGAQVNLGTEFDHDALAAAASKGHTELVRMLLDAGVDADAHGRSYDSAICVAADQGHLDVVKVIVNAGGNVNVKSSLGTPLRLAARKGHRDVVTFLVEEGALVNMSDINGSALCTACRNGHEDIVRLLIQAGADVNLPEGGVFHSSLHAAAKGGHDQILEILIDTGANVNVDNQSKGTSSALCLAAGWGRETSVQKLIAAGADVNAIGPQGPPLVLATRQNRVEVVKRLIAAGADVNGKAPSLPTALYVAQNLGHISIAQILLNAGAVPDAGLSQFEPDR